MTVHASPGRLEATGDVLTREGVWTTDTWTVVREASTTDLTTLEAALLPFGDYLEQVRSSNVSAGARGAWLSPADDPAALAPHLSSLPLIAVEFPVFSDGRGYSTASLLRRRYAYDGDLRAIGDVLIDQLFFLRRVGFSSFVLRADQDRARAVLAISTFSEVYQGAADQPLPAFRRHARPAAAAGR